jgi:hypothetical protein
MLLMKLKISHLYNIFLFFCQKSLTMFNIMTPDGSRKLTIVARAAQTVFVSLQSSLG